MGDRKEDAEEDRFFTQLPQTMPGITPDKEEFLESTYGKGAKILLKMGLGAEHLKKTPISTENISIGRRGFGFYESFNPTNEIPIVNMMTSQPHNSKAENPAPMSEYQQLMASTIKHRHKNVDKALKTFSSPRVKDPTPHSRWSLDKNFVAATAAQQTNELADAFQTLEIQNNQGKIKDSLPDEKYFQLLVNECEIEIHQNARKIKYTTERVITINQLRHQLTEKINEETQLIKDMEVLSRAIGNGNENTILNNECLDKMHQALTVLKNYDQFWNDWGFGDCINPILIPVIKREIGPEWNPLDKPLEPAPLYEKWQSLLSDRPLQFELLLRETYLPPLRNVLKVWDLKEPEKVINLLQEWNEVFPLKLTNYIKWKLIWPKLCDKIHEWDPKGKGDNIVTPIWLQKWTSIFAHPFLDLSANNPVLIEQISIKIQGDLKEWHPTQKWAKNTMIVWKEMLPTPYLEQIERDIVDRLKSFLRMELKLETLKFNDFPLLITLAWYKKAHLDITEVIEKAFFPLWLQFLSRWLQENPGPGQLRKWYLFWKKKIPKALLQNFTILENLNKALMMIDSALNASALVRATEKLCIEEKASTSIQQELSDRSHNKTEKEHIEKSEVLLDAKKLLDMTPQVFRDLVQMKCEEKGIIFCPYSKWDGKQTYKCNKSVIYIAGNVIYAADKHNNGWVPRSLDELLG